MKNLNEKELKEVKGGFGFWGAVLIFSGVTFLSGLLDGISRPNRCN